MTEDLVSQLKAMKDLDQVLVFSFQVDLPFVEGVIQPALRKAGNPRLSMFVDSREASKAFINSGKWCAGLGKTYRLIPVHSEGSGCFHPKIVFAASQTNATLFVGSGNLTFGGCRQNAEIWSRFDTDGYAGPIKGFQQFLIEVQESCTLSQQGADEIQRSFDEAKHHWVSSLPEATGILWRSWAPGPSLLVRLGNEMDGEAIDELYVCSPYYDPGGNALRELERLCPQAQIHVLVQEGKSDLTQEMVNSLEGNAMLHTARPTRGDDPPPFLHAKFYAFRRGDSVTVWLGSANCSAAALLKSGVAGNAEAMVRWDGSFQEFQQEFLEELQLVREQPELRVATEPQLEKESEGLLPQISSASFYRGGIDVKFMLPDGAIPVALLVDGERQGQATFPGPSSGYLRLSKCPQAVALVARVDGGDGEICSEFHWVDQETSLGRSSAGQNLGEYLVAINDETVTPDLVSEICNLFSHKIRSDVTFGAGGRRSETVEREEEAHPITREDIYCQSPFPSWDGTFSGSQSQSFPTSLPALVLALTGHQPAELCEGLEQDDAHDPQVEEGEGFVEMQSSSRGEPRSVETGDQQQAQRKYSRSLSSVFKKLVSPDHLQSVTLEALLANLSAFGLLLLHGKSNGWVSSSEYSEYSSKLWKAYFINGSSSSGGEAQRGAISLHGDEDREDVEPRLLMLTAALLTIWALSPPEFSSQDEKNMFHFTLCFALAQQGWIWKAPSPKDLGEEIARVGHVLHVDDEGIQSSLISVDTWNVIAAEGSDLQKLEQHLVRSVITQTDIPSTNSRIRKGTLVWQLGLGYGICLEEVSEIRRSGSRSIQVDFFQAGGGPLAITADYIRTLDEVRSMRDS